MKPNREPILGGVVHRGWGEAALVFLLVLFVSLPRLVRLTADPAPGVHANALFDEGGWAHNARNKALFGQWIIDRPLRIPVAILVPGFLVLEPVRFAAGLLRPTNTLIDASRALSVMESQLPAGRHAMEGELAATLAMETGLLTFYRRDKGSNLPLNRNGFSRFQPVLQVVAQTLPVRAGRMKAHAEGFAPCREFRLWRDRAGKPRWLAMLYARPGFCPPRSEP